MPAMIKLKLPSTDLTFAEISKLPGLRDLKLDASFGLLMIDPKAFLFVVRAESVDQIEHRRSLSPEILEAYGDVRISTT